MSNPLVLSEEHYVDLSRSPQEKGMGEGITFVRTAFFLPTELTDLQTQPFTEEDLRQAESYVVLTSLDRPGAPPLAGFVTWKPMPLDDDACPYVHTNRTGTGASQWRLGYGYVPLHNPDPDDDLLRETDRLAAPIVARTNPRLFPILARRLQAELWLADTFNSDLANSLAEAYGNHVARLVRNQR